MSTRSLTIWGLSCDEPKCDGILSFIDLLLRRNESGPTLQHSNR